MDNVTLAVAALVVKVKKCIINMTSINITTFLVLILHHPLLIKLFNNICDIKDATFIKISLYQKTPASVGRGFDYLLDS